MFPFGSKPPKRLSMALALLCVVNLPLHANDSTRSGNSNAPVTDTSSARLLAQASFGATLTDIERVKSLGIQGWIDNQLSLKGESHLKQLQDSNANGSNSADRVHLWWLEAIDAPDQLRGRVAFALSEIFVVSDVQQTLGHAQMGLANYYDILKVHAFGNFRDLLTDITLSPVMGVYLSMMQNAKANPATNTRADENFARELMQLFTIGLHELNLDGTLKLNNGKPINTYTQDDIKEYARALTGWGYGNTDRWDAHPASQYANFLVPMAPFSDYHDTGEKRLLGGITLPAGQPAIDDLHQVLDSLFLHPNVGPFISKQLIQRLVTSNPSADYVARVASKFNNNGQGIRGDMGAVVRAILLDEEARSGHLRIPNFGKIREPVLRLSHLWRAFNAQFAEGSKTYTANPQLNGLDIEFGQTILGSPSVFNFFLPSYAPSGPIKETGLVSPEAELYTENYVLTANTFLNTYIQKFHVAEQGNLGVQFETHIDITPQVNLAKNPEALLKELNLTLLSNQMSAEMHQLLSEHLNALPNSPKGHIQRVLDAISLIMASPSYLVQK